MSDFWKHPIALSILFRFEYARPIPFKILEFVTPAVLFHQFL